MKLENSTTFTNHFLRRLVSWCCGQIELPVSRVVQITVTNCRVAYRGRAWPNEILVRIGPDERFPVGPYRYGGYESPGLTDRIEALVWLIAHELTHVLINTNTTSKSRRDREYSCEWHAHQVCKVFQKDRTALLDSWHAEPRRSAALARPKPSLVAIRAAKANSDLTRWLRKLKLAQTKVKQYRRKVAYYTKTVESPVEECP